MRERLNLSHQWHQLSKCVRCRGGGGGGGGGPTCQTCSLADEGKVSHASLLKLLLSYLTLRLVFQIRGCLGQSISAHTLSAKPTVTWSQKTSELLAVLSAIARLLPSCRFPSILFNRFTITFSTTYRRVHQGHTTAPVYRRSCVPLMHSSSTVEPVTAANPCRQGRQFTRWRTNALANSLEGCDWEESSTSF